MYLLLKKFTFYEQMKIRLFGDKFSVVNKDAENYNAFLEDFSNMRIIKSIMTGHFQETRK